MIPIIKNIEASTFVGKSLEMSIESDKTRQLWGRFMPHRRLVQAVVGAELYSIECYPQTFFQSFQPQMLFEKWAAVKVSRVESIPEGMKVLQLPAGVYAVFTYKGLASNVAVFYESIFTEYLPAQGFEIDNRPHFAVMGTSYKNDDPESEEEIWIPIKKI